MRHTRQRRDFYPRSPCGERLHTKAHRAAYAVFLSTLSLRRATAASMSIFAPPYNFYPRSPCGERPSYTSAECGRIAISIHALLAESDLVIRGVLTCAAQFLSTLSLRRATLHFLPSCFMYSVFLSTLSLRRATRRYRTPCQTAAHFYPRSPCGERLALLSDYVSVDVISIHALLAESDVSKARQIGVVDISIHALLAESDSCCLWLENRQ